MAMAARIHPRSVATRLSLVLALLGLSAASAFATAVGVSFTTSGSPGAWVLNFSFTNNIPGQVLYFFGVNLPTQDVVSSPSGFLNCWFTGCSKTTINTSTDLAPVTTSLNETFDDLWHIAQIPMPPVIQFGSTASGFEALATTLTAPTSVDWFAFTAEGSLPYLGNENFAYSGDCLSAQSVTCAVLSQENPVFSGTGSAVPEPGTVVFLASGLIGLIGLRGRRIPSRKGEIMNWKPTVLIFALSLAALPVWGHQAANQPKGGPGRCTDVPLLFVVASQTAGQGGVSGDGLSIYNNPNDPAFNGGSLYQDGVDGVYVRFQVCNGTNDFVLNLRSTNSPARFMNLDFSAELATADTANGAIDLTGKQIQQQGLQINEMANASLYSGGKFVTCSGMMLNPLSASVTGANGWFKPPTIYDPTVPDCTGGTGPDLANQPVNTSAVQVQQVDACTWTVTPLFDSTGASYRFGVAETLKQKRTSTLAAGGQYQMPFSYKIQKLNCTP